MRILLDSDTPAGFVGALRGHQVTRARQMGWEQLANGRLLDAAEQAGFDLLLTCDQNLRFQQNFANRRIAMVGLSSNRWPYLRPHKARIATAVDFAQPGQVVWLDVASK